MSLQGLDIIQYYNRLNGNSISLEKLKAFRKRVESHIESTGTGPHMTDLKGILARVSKAIKSMIDAGADIAERVELVPIDISKTTGKILRVASGYEEKVESPKHKAESSSTGNVKEISIASIHTDTKRFQNRTDAFSEASANNVALHFDANKFDPIVVWKDPKNGKTYVLSGHSRLEGMKRRNSKTIPVRYFSGNEEEAIKFARVEANRSANAENLIEDLAAYKLMRDGKEGVKPATKTELQRIFKGKVGKLEAYSYLNTGGLFVQSLSQSNTSNYPYLERNAQWVGILRNQYPVISHTGEDNIFHFFYSDKSGRNIKISKDDFFALAKKKVNQLRAGESVLFPECNSDGCKQTVDREADPQKGEAFKRLREINEALESIREKLTSKNASVRVTTEEEKKYLRATAEKLEEEKQRINRDLDLIDKSQASLFGVEYHAGNKIKFTGVVKEMYGGIFYQYKILDGHKKGQIGWTQREPKKLNGPQIDAFNIEPKKKHRGPLNPLQMAQLQDAIKAGRTPKVNLKAKLNAKEKPAPLFDQPVNDPRQASLFGAKKTKGVSASSLAGMEFKTLPFAGRWKDHIGTPSENFSAMVWGKPKQGKTHYSFQFANYLSQFGPVLYVLSDEGIGYTVKEKIIANGLDKNDKVHFIETRQVSEVENAIKSGNYKFIFIDLISNLRNGDEPLKADGFYQLRKRYPQVSFIPVFSSTKNGNFRGDQEWAHDVDVLVDVEAGKATAQGRFGGGEYEIFKKVKSGK